MTRIKEKTYLQLGKKRKHSHTFLPEATTTVASENASSEIIHDLKRKPSIENPVLPVMCSLPPPPRYIQHRNKAYSRSNNNDDDDDAHTNIQTRSTFIATAKKPCLCRSNTLGHPSSSSPLDTPDQDHPPPPPPPPPMSVAAVDGFTKDNQAPQTHSLYPLELHTDILLLDDDLMSLSRTPSLVNFPDSPSSSISRI
jgi:hypothetical protein